MAAQIHELGRPACYLPFDVRDVAAVQAGVSQIMQTHGAIDILINCASQFESAPLDTLDAATWNAVLQSNLTGTFH